MRGEPQPTAAPGMSSTSSRWARSLVWSALAIVVFAWTCKLLAVAARETGLAAQALYFAELASERREAAPSSPAPTVEAIATEVHKRTVRQLGWIGGGLMLCALAALSAPARLAAIAASSVLYVAGWMLLDGYFDVGLVEGLDLKLRLVRGDRARMFDFLVFDVALPGVVAAVGGAVLAMRARQLLR